jgi:F-type H+-transporting ATPase subunit gamma
MANLKDIKGRIHSVKSTQKITNAMKLVSAAKFARASHAVQASRPFFEKMNAMISKLAAMAVARDLSSELIRQRPEKKALLVIVGTDRGLCGSLNAGLFKTAGAWMDEKAKQGVAVGLYLLGRRSISFGKRRKLEIVGTKERMLDKPSFEQAKVIVDDFLKAFLSGEWDHVYIAYPKYKSALVQNPEVIELLPISMDVASPGAANAIVEPKLEEIIDGALSKQLMTAVYQILLEGAASEHGARMTAMDSATNNAGEVIKKLTIQYNRARQAAITTELIEIISGAEAL